MVLWLIFNEKASNITVEEPSFIDGNCLLIKTGSETAIIAIYRSPSYTNIDNFLTSLEDILKTLNNFKTIIIVGDINIAINQDKLEKPGERYLALIAFHGLLPAHTLVTRDKSGTCIDHVFLRTKLPSLTILLSIA